MVVMCYCGRYANVPLRSLIEALSTEADPEGADGWKLSADITLCSWAASLSLKRNPNRQTSEHRIGARVLSLLLLLGGGGRGEVGVKVEQGKGKHELSFVYLCPPAPFYQKLIKLKKPW